MKPTTQIAAEAAEQLANLFCVTGGAHARLIKHAPPSSLPPSSRRRMRGAKEQPINTHRRLFDLVRNCRAQLHAEDLITDDEYAWLCGHEFKEDKGKSGSPSPRRLEDYDAIRAELTALRGLLEEADQQLAKLLGGMPTYDGFYLNARKVREKIARLATERKEDKA